MRLKRVSPKDPAAKAAPAEAATRPSDDKPVAAKSIRRRLSRRTGGFARWSDRDLKDRVVVVSH